MAGVALPNLAGALENPIEAIGSAFANAPIQAADQNAALNAAGWKTLTPYILALSRNPNLAQNQSFVGQMQRTAQLYRISGPMLNEAIEQLRGQLGGGQPPAGASGGAVQTGPASPAQSPSGGASQPAPSSPSQTSSAPSSPQPTTKPVGGEPNLGTQWQDPKLKQAAGIYQQDLEAAARTPALTGHPQFQAKIMRDARAVGRGSPQIIAADVKAAQLKAGTGPHPEHMPPDQAQIRQQRQQALSGGQPSASASTTQTTPATDQGGTGTAQPQTSAVPPGTPGAGAAGPTSYSGPHALPPAMQGLMAAAGVTPTGMQAYGTASIEAGLAQQIAQAQPSDRPQLYAASMIDPTTVPSDIMNAKPVMTEAQRGIEWNRVYGEAMTLVKQGQDPTGIIQGAARAGVITPDMAQSFLSDPSVMEPLRDAAAQNLTTLQNNGLLKGARYQEYLQQIQTAPTTRALNEARTKYLGTQQQWYGSQAQARVAEAWSTVKKNNATTTSISDGTWFQQNTVQGRSMNDQIKDAQSLLTSSQTNYDTILNYGKSLQANFQDPTTATMPDGTPYAQALQSAKEERDAAHSAVLTLKNNAAAGATSTVNAAAGGAKVKGGGPPFSVPKGYKAEKINGHWAVRSLSNPKDVQFWQGP